MGGTFWKGLGHSVMGLFGLGGLVKEDDLLDKTKLNAVKEAFAQTQAQLQARYNRLEGEVTEAQRKLIEEQLELQEVMLQEQIQSNTQRTQYNSFIAQALVFLVLLLFLFMFMSL